MINENTNENVKVNRFNLEKAKLEEAWKAKNYKHLRSFFPSSSRNQYLTCYLDTIIKIIQDNDTRGIKSPENSSEEAPLLDQGIDAHALFMDSGELFIQHTLAMEALNTDNVEEIEHESKQFNQKCDAYIDKYAYKLSVTHPIVAGIKTLYALTIICAILSLSALALGAPLFVPVIAAATVAIFAKPLWDDFASRASHVDQKLTGSDDKTVAVYNFSKNISEKINEHPNKPPMFKLSCGTP